MEQRTEEKTLNKVIVFIVLLLLLIFALFPLLWIFLTSIKNQKDLFAIPPLFIFKPTLEHWKQVLIESEFLRYYKNSLIIATITVLVVIVVVLSFY